MNYFLKIDGEETGSLSAEQIRRRLSEKGLTGDDLVRREDSAEWVPLGTLGEFRASLESPVPERNPLATVSLVLGYGSLLLLFLMELLKVPVFWFASIASIVCGHMALSKINRSHLPVRGRGTARGGLWLGYTITFLPVLAILGSSRGHGVQERGNQTKGVSNCRQIITTLRLYSSDHDGKYPDAESPEIRSSNAAFRRMFVSEEADNEMIFGCPSSRCGQPDGNIGQKPDFREAVQPDENH